MSSLEEKEYRDVLSYNSLPNGLRKYLARREICDMDSAQSWVAESGLMIVQAALRLVSAAGNTVLTATGKRSNIGSVEEWHRHRRKLKPHKKKPHWQLYRQPYRQPNPQNWTVWTQKQHEAYMTRSTYAP